MIRVAVLVTGSRDWTDYRPIADRLKLYPESTTVLHGDCGKWSKETQTWIGADKIADVISRKFGFLVHAYPYFSDAGLRGGPLRNECMLQALLNMRRFGYDCYVEAFPMPHSKGTRGMIELVERHNRDDRTPKKLPLYIAA